jgi:hypothetical protein
MNGILKKWTAATLALAALVWLGVGTASAVGTSDSVTITITPSAAYVITITTAASGANLGSVPLNSSTFTAQASTVSVTSTFAWTGLKIQGAVSSPGGTPWSLVSTNTSVQDGLSAWALFTDTSIVTAPATTVLTSSNAIVGTGQFTVGAIGNPGCGAGTGTGAGLALFERQTGGVGLGLKHMECLPPVSLDTYGAQPHMFLYFQTPPTSTDLAHAQLVTFTLTANAPQ